MSRAGVTEVGSGNGWELRANSVALALRRLTHRRARTRLLPSLPSSTPPPGVFANEYSEFLVAPLSAVREQNRARLFSLAGSPRSNKINRGKSSASGNKGGGQNLRI